MRFIRTSIHILCIFIATTTPISFSDEIAMRLGGPVEITTELLPYGYKGVEYSTRIYVTGGSGEFIFHPTSLPSGLTLKESGRLEGVITADIGTHSFRIIASDTLDVTKLYEKKLTLTIFKKLAFRKELIKPAVKGAAYKQKIKITGGSGDFKFLATGLPKGLSIDQSGLITGIPVGLPGNSDLELIVLDLAFKDKKIVRTEPFTLYSAVNIITPKIPIIKKQGAVNTTINAEGGSGDYSFSSDDLPAGLKLETSGRLTGMTSVPRGRYKITINVTDPNTHAAAAKQFHLTVVDFFPDEYESFNDNDIQTTNTMVPGNNEQVHSFNRPGDTDFIRLDLRKVLPDDVVHIKVHKKHPSTKPVLTLYSSEKKIISKGKENATDFLYKCITPDFYYAGVTEASGETGEYRFSLINKGPATRFETQSLPDVLKKSKISLTLRGIEGSGNYQFKAERLPKGLRLSKHGILSGLVNIPAGDYTFNATVNDTDWKGISETRLFTFHVVDFFPDRYEFLIDNDFETQNRIRPGNITQYHSFNTKGDKDYIKLDLRKLTPGNLIDIQAKQSTVTTKPLITLFKSNKSKISNSKQTKKGHRLLFECKIPGIYYILAEEALGNTGDYKLSVIDTGPKVTFKTESIPDVLKKGKNNILLQAKFGSGRYHFSAKKLPGNFSLSSKGLLSVEEHTGLKKGAYPFSATLKDLEYPEITVEKQFILTIVDFYPDQFELEGDNSFETSNRVTPENVFQYHTFNYDGDVDYIGLDLTNVVKDSVICISTSANSAPAKAGIQLFDHQKKSLNEMPKNKKSPSSVRYFKCTDPGQYFLKISEAENRTADYGLHIKNLGLAPTIITDSLPDVLTGRKYSKKIIVKNGSGHYRYKTKGIPDNLKMNTAGVINGKLPVASGLYPFEVIVEDIKYPGIVTRKKMVLKVVEFFPDVFEKSGDNNYCTTNHLTPDGKEQKHTFNFKGDTDYTRIDLSGCTPGDLIKIRTTSLTKKTEISLTLFDADFNKIINNPTDKTKNYSQIIYHCKSPGLYYLKVTETKNDVGDYSLRLINTGQQLQIRASSVSDILWGQPYNSQLPIEGGSGKFRLKVENIPSNLSVSNKGLITGTTKIKSNETYTFKVSAYDAIHPENTVQKTISMNVVDYYPDPYEKNNDNDFSTTNTLTPENKQKHNFNFPGDEDFIRLDLSKVKREDVIIIQSSRSGRLTDTHVTLYDIFKKELLKDDNSGVSGYSKIVFQCQTPGIYFLKTESVTKTTGAYLIEMNNSGQPVAITTKNLPMAESPESYSSVLKTSGGCGKYTFSIKKGALPNGLRLNKHSGVISGKNKNWGKFNVVITAKDKKFPENQIDETFLIDAYVGKKLTGTESVNYPFYVGETLNAEGYYNSMTAIPSLIQGGIKKNIRYRIIKHNIPEKRFNVRFNNKTGELTLKEAAIVACTQYQNLDLDVTIEANDIVNKNNKMRFKYQIPVKCLVY